MRPKYDPNIQKILLVAHVGIYGIHLGLQLKSFLCPYFGRLHDPFGLFDVKAWAPLLNSTPEDQLPR